MWNPLHFAVYYQNVDLLRYLIKTMKVNLALTAPKAPAENERENVNSERYTEDKILILLLAYDRKNPQILKYLLDEGHKFWPSKKTIEKLLKERLFEEVTRYCAELSLLPDPAHDPAESSLNVMTRTWLQMGQAILRSRTAHAFFGGLSLKKRAEWIRNLAYDLDADGLKGAPELFKESIRNELAL